MSEALELTAAAAPTLSKLITATGPTTPLTSRWGAATLSRPALVRVAVRDMPSGEKIRSRRKSSQPPARGRRHHLSRGHVHDVAVGVAAAEARGGRKVADATHDLGARESRGRPPHEVALAEAEARAVGHEVADRDLARHPRVVHLESRQVLRDRVVPGELPVLDQDRQRRAGEGLRVRGDAEERVRVHPLGLPHPTDSVALRQDDLPVLDHGHRHPRHPELPHRARDVRVEAGEGRGRPRLRQGRRRGE